MTRQNRFLLYGAIAAAGYYFIKKRRDNEIMAGAAAVAASGANAPNTNVSPTAAATTNNMQALAGLGYAISPPFLGGVIPIDARAYARLSRETNSGAL
jgi:hypothetical protein